MAGVVRTIPSHLGRPATPRAVKAPRPPNAWILYRSDKVHQLPPLEPGQPRRAQSDVSKIISAMWANESDETRQEYERRAEEAKAQHALKYPGYRFNPMKKEEKRVQKEQELSERLAKRREWRKSESTPDRSSVPPFTAPLPQYYASINMPINLPQFGHGFVAPLPYPLMSFCHLPQAHFGPGGPTPPVSAAPSPADPSPSPATSTSTDEAQSSSNTTESIDPNFSAANQSKSMTSPAPSPAISASVLHTPLFPTFNSPAFASGQEWAGAPTPATTDNGTLTPALTPSSLWEDLDSNQQQLQTPQEQHATTQAVLSNTVSFNLEPFHLSNLANLLPGSTDEVLSTFVNPSNAGILQLSSIDPTRLTASPVGEVEISLGDSFNLDLSLFSPGFLNVGDSLSLPQPNTTVHELFIPQSIPNVNAMPIESHESSTLNVGYNPDDYLDFGATSAFGEKNEVALLGSEAATTQAGQCVTSMGPYVPPAGATNSSIRRVGGSWTKQLMKTQTPNPPRATGMTQSQ